MQLNEKPNTAMTLLFEISKRILLCIKSNLVVLGGSLVKGHQILQQSGDTAVAVHWFKSTYCIATLHRNKIAS